MDSFNPALKKIGLWILENKEDLKYLKIKDLATICGVADSTVIRFVKAIGLSSFNDFRIIVSSVTPELHEEPSIERYESIEENDSLDIIINKIEQQYLYAIKNTIKNVNKNYIENAINIINKAKNIYFFCLGISVSNSQHAATRFLRIGKKCCVTKDIAEMAMISNHTDKNDVVITICFSGKTQIYNKTLTNIKSNKTPIILVTGNRMSKLSEMADVILLTQVSKFSEYMVSMVNRISINLLLDILYVGVCMKDYKKSKESLWKISNTIKETLEQ